MHGALLPTSEWKWLLNFLTLCRAAKTYAITIAVNTVILGVFQSFWISPSPWYCITAVIIGRICAKSWMYVKCPVYFRCVGPVHDFTQISSNFFCHFTNFFIPLCGIRHCGPVSLKADCTTAHDRTVCTMSVWTTACRSIVVRSCCTTAQQSTFSLLLVSVVLCSMRKEANLTYFWCSFQFYLISNYFLHYYCFIFPLSNLI